MAQSRIFTGARAIIFIGENQVGLFANCSWSIRQDKAPAYVLGRFNPVEITSTSQEPVQMSLTGYRVVEHGPYANMGVKQLQQLLNDDDDFVVKVVDRRDATAIFTAEGCKVAGWSSGAAARGVSDVRVDVIGLKGFDESATGGDDTGGSTLT